MKNIPISDAYYALLKVYAKKNKMKEGKFIEFLLAEWKG
jgi:hypothetical protein